MNAPPSLRTLCCSFAVFSPFTFFLPHALVVLVLLCGPALAQSDQDVTGVCCYLDECDVELCRIEPEAHCAALGGKWYPEYHDCARYTCRSRACCVGDECTVVTAFECDELGGVALTEWRDCGPPNPCVYPTRACCTGDNCVLLSKEDCSNSGGEWHSNWVSCSPNNCVYPQGACCIGEECQVLTGRDCADLAGRWWPSWNTCDPNPCAVRGEDYLFPGVYICHHDPAISYSAAKGVCERFTECCAIESCAEQNPSIMTTEPSLWFVLSAFLEDKRWCLIDFGFGDYPPDLFTFTSSGPCTPGQFLEIPTADWPGPKSGTAVTTTTVHWRGNFVPVYYFAGYAYNIVGQIPLAKDPVTSFAGWVSCEFVPPRESGERRPAEPPQQPYRPREFRAMCLPSLGVLMEGVSCCPAPPWPSWMADSSEVRRSR